MKQIWQRVAVFAAAAILLLSASRLAGHGELAIQIAAMTREIEASSTNNAALFLARGELYREHQDWDAAEADFIRARELDPSLARVDVCRGLLLSDRGEFAAARAMLDQAILRSPNSGEAYIARARLLKKLGERSAAIPDYRHALRNVRLPDPEWFLELAELLRAEGKTDEALTVLDEGIRKIPVSPLHETAFDIELERNNHAAALMRLDSILESASRKEQWLTKRAEVLLMAGRTREARSSLDAALEAITLLPERIRKGKPIQELTVRINNAIAQTDLITQPVNPE